MCKNSYGTIKKKKKQIAKAVTKKNNAEDKVTGCFYGSRH
jgi:hypothetical protein